MHKCVSASHGNHGSTDIISNVHATVSRNLVSSVADYGHPKYAFCTVRNEPLFLASTSPKGERSKHQNVSKTYVTN